MFSESCEDLTSLGASSFVVCPHSERWQVFTAVKYGGVTTTLEPEKFFRKNERCSSKIPSRAFASSFPIRHTYLFHSIKDFGVFATEKTVSNTIIQFVRANMYSYIHLYIWWPFCKFAMKVTQCSGDVKKVTYWVIILKNGKTFLSDIVKKVVAYKHSDYIVGQKLILLLCKDCNWLITPQLVWD